MTQITPGDWEYSEGRLQAWQEVKGLPRKVPIARLASLEGEAEMDANGSLLEAAPCYQAALEWIYGNCPHIETRKVAKAALDKTNGGKA